MKFTIRHPVLYLLLLATVAGAHAADKPAVVTSVGRYPIEEADPSEYLSAIRLPKGFSIEIYQGSVAGARSMALSPAGTLFVGTRTARDRSRIGKVYAVPNAQQDSSGDGVITLAEGLHVPNGVAFRDGSLYVAEINRILRYDNIEAQLQQAPAPVVVNDSLPDKFHHGWKYLRFGPDDRLYVPVGAPCNSCEVDEGEATIISMKADGSDQRIYASGIRNSVGFDWDPATGELWFTDNGRDLWGDDVPPDELNHASGPGQHFGYPYRYGKDMVDEAFETALGEANFTPAAMEFPAHNALLGMHFYTGQQFPTEYRGDLFIASHGSWNRATADGYKIFRVKMDKGRAVAYEEFASGWLTPENQYWGRPVDVVQAADGSLLVSDDFAGVIYRISYTGPT